MRGVSSIQDTFVTIAGIDETKPGSKNDVVDYGCVGEASAAREPAHACYWSRVGAGIASRLACGSNRGRSMELRRARLVGRSRTGSGATGSPLTADEQRLHADAHVCTPSLQKPKDL